MTPAEIVRRALFDATVALIEGAHDGIGDAVLDALAAEGWSVVKLSEPVVQSHEPDRALYRIVERAR